MAIIQLLGNEAGRSQNLGSTRLLNVYPHVMPDQTVSLIGTPGLRSKVSSGSYGSIRMMTTSGSKLVTVAGGKIVVMNSAFGVTYTYDMHTSTGTCYADTNGVYTLIVDGVAGYLLNAACNAVTELTSADGFPSNPSTVCFIDGYFIVNDYGTGNFHYCEEPYSNTWNAIDYAVAESSPDNIKRVLSAFGLLYLFGEKTTEIWSSSGDANVFLRISANVAQVGTPSAASVVRIGESGQNLLWIASTNHGEGFAVLSRGGQEVTRITTPEVEYKWSKYSTINDATAYGYSQEGHVFYVVNFPTADKTWCYDLLSKRWHERGGDLTRHLGEKYVHFNGEHLVSRYDTFEIFKLDMDYYYDDAVAMLREVVTPTYGGDEQRTSWNCVQLDMERGVGSGGDIEETMEVQFTYSDDCGRSWYPERVLSFGGVGEYTKRVITWQLGRTWRRTFRIRIWNPVKVVLINMMARVTP